jgi:beta-lactamase regulating signal transducer with metallopeptidase domain
MSVTSPAAAVLTWKALAMLANVGVAGVMVLLLIQKARFVRALVAQSKAAPADLLELCEDGRRRLGLHRTIGVQLSPNIVSPATCGLLRPTILIPEYLQGQLPHQRLQAVLLHELAHIQRGDLWVNLVQTLLQFVYFYTPLLWLANAIIRRIREQAVDEAVLVAMGEQAGQYPQTLVAVAKLALDRPTPGLRLIGIVETKSALSGRIKHILGRPTPKSARLGFVGSATLCVLAAALLPMGWPNATYRARQVSATRSNTPGEPIRGTPGSSTVVRVSGQTPGADVRGLLTSPADVGPRGNPVVVQSEGLMIVTSSR